MAPNAAEFWCKLCKLPFATDGAFKKHKVNSARHICCDVCGQDFNSEEGKKRHRAAHHAEEQDLTCKFCGLNYPRMGSLINHYEEGKCKKVSSEVFKDAIKDTMSHNQAIRKAHNFKDIRRSSEFLDQNEEPLPPFRQASNSPVNSGDAVTAGRGSASMQYNGGGDEEQGGAWSTHGNQDSGVSDEGWPSAAQTGYGMDPPLINVTPDVPISPDEDLISFDPMSAILNSSWSIPAGEVLKNNPLYHKANEFPALSSIAVKQGSGQNAGQNADRGTGKAAGRGSGQAPSQGGTQSIAPGSVNPGTANKGLPHTWGKQSTTPAVNQSSTLPPHLRGKTTVPATSTGTPQNSAPLPANFANTSWPKFPGSPTSSASSTIGNKPNMTPGSGPGLRSSQTSRPPTNQIGQTSANIPTISRPDTQQIGQSSAKIQPTPNPWGSKNLFPDAPAAVEPPVDLLTSLSIGPTAATPVYRQFDPADPNFRASRFYVNLLQKWKCPYPGCNVSSKTQQAFVNHLNSPTHSDEKFQCLRCYRYYSSATALAQHAESQGVRCNIRETDDFGLVVRGITADTATTNGRLQDNTVRYEINPDAVLHRTQMADNLRAAHKAKEDENLNYWRNNTPTW
ncbi:hypothetical protein VTL71DRAFT_26 [Oculimacula yallundae]|uniref:C2H2-type domain-containing protein n=1 Tax=Oculimacula yallundae TaxID=86028 RepID=A0ABR4CYW8_9HELO